jgi:hypothetical protein
MVKLNTGFKVDLLLKLAQMEINEMTNSFATFNGVEVLKGFDLTAGPEETKNRAGEEFSA